MQSIMPPKNPNVATEAISECTPQSKLNNRTSCNDRSDSKKIKFNKKLGHEQRRNSLSTAAPTNSEENSRDSPTTAPIKSEEDSSSGRERLKRHRIDMAGRVWIPELWGQEDFLKDWIDCTVFDAALRNNGIMSARASLMEQGTPTTPPNPC